ncbi:DUF418 domain-containing protein [Colwelliaceae bacterium BS250]
MNVQNNRILMIDALRGFALAGIFLLHHIQHFNFFVKPEFTPSWLIPIDAWLKDSMNCLIAGKAFALFSLLFGLSYWIIYENAQKRGDEYLFRHFWRMALLVCFGLFHTLFFAGDILIMYAVLGLPLVLTRYMSNKAMLCTAFVLLINPVSVATILSYVFTDNIYSLPLSYPEGSLKPLLIGGSFGQLMQAHFNFAYLSSVIWSWNVGRIVAILGLFFLGAYFAKNKTLTEGSLKFWYYFLIISLISLVCLNFINDLAIASAENKDERRLLWQIMQRYIKITMALGILSIFIILWRHNKGTPFFSKFINFGRMGLTNYILMSIFGSFLYYGWGLGLYKYLGISASLAIGITLLVVQIKFSTFWFNKFGQGPLERLWRRLTWLNSHSNNIAKASTASFTKTKLSEHQHE